MLLASVFGYQQVDKNQRQPNRRTEQRSEGDVRVDNAKNQKSHYSKDEGEYVDFEEID